MALRKRHLVLGARLAALAAFLFARKGQRKMSWMAHDALWLYPTLRRNCDWHGEVVTHFQTDKKEVWLSIDDGPDPRDTPQILELLAHHQATAAFFMIGEKVDQHRALCRQVLKAGHVIGNHTYSHPAAAWWALPRIFARQEIARGSHAIHTATGLAPHYFRSPVGMNSPAVHPSCAAQGLRVIGWSADGADGCPAAPNQIVAKIMKGVKPGAIILLHESGKSKHRVLTLRRLLETLSEEGYRCVIPPPEALR